jgi:DNA-binding MurR/RpiR family transcriptional regulator
MKERKETPGCLVRINGLFSDLRESEKKVAEYIRRNYEQVIHLSISEVAEEAGASESTVVRLCKALDYRGFQDFKIHLAGEYRSTDSQIHEGINKKDDSLEIKKKVFESDIAAVRDTLQVLDDRSFLHALEILRKADTIELYGTGGSGTVVMDVQHKFLKIGKKCFAYRDIDLQAMSASLVGPGDAVVGISHSGGNKNILDALKIARKAGASIISVTNYGRSPITRISDVVLFTASRETAFKSDAMSSRIAELVIFDALWAALAFSDHDAAFDNIKKTRAATSGRKH